MKYLVAILVILPSFYSFSYARYCWNKKNKIGAFGILLASAISIILPSIVIFII